MKASNSGDFVHLQSGSPSLLIFRFLAVGFRLVLNATSMNAVPALESVKVLSSSLLESAASSSDSSPFYFLFFVGGALISLVPLPCGS